MGSFLGCFGGEINHKRRKPRAKRTCPQIQRNRVQDVHHETVSTAEETTTGSPLNTLFAEFRNKPVEEEKLSPSPRKKVAFSSNITTYEHDLVSESVESLVECNADVGIENHFDMKRTSAMNSLLETSDISTIGSFPPNHRYHNARESDDEPEFYGDSDMENFDEDDFDYFNDYEPVLASSTESKRENYAINEEVDSRIILMIQPPASPRDSSDHIDYVVNSIENITQSKAVDTSLSNWLDSPEKTMLKKTSTNFLDDCNLNKFEDRPILGALTVEELRQISANSTPRKSPSRSPDEIPIIGTVGTYWNHSASSPRSDSASPSRGLPNTTSKYGEDVGVNWDSTSFETRLDRALNLGALEA